MWIRRTIFAFRPTFQNLSKNIFIKKDWELSHLLLASLLFTFSEPVRHSLQLSVLLLSVMYSISRRKYYFSLQFGIMIFRTQLTCTWLEVFFCNVSIFKILESKIYYFLQFASPLLQSCRAQAVIAKKKWTHFSTKASVFTHTVLTDCIIRKSKIF